MQKKKHEMNVIHLYALQISLGSDQSLEKWM